jgi:hypothetical protein
MNKKFKIVFGIIVPLLIGAFLTGTAGSRLFKKALALGMPSAEIQTLDVEIVRDGTWGKPADYGFSRFQESLRAKGISFKQSPSLAQTSSSRVVLIGTRSESNEIEKLLREGKLELSPKKEALAVKKIKESSKDILVIAGADDRGLMYALLELVKQIEVLEKAENWFTFVKEVSENPFVPVRGMVVLLHNEDCERDWYYSKEYWNEYIGMLAENRWNSFNLVFSHQTPYLSPMYAFHVKVEQYPEVKAKGLTEEQRQKNLNTLRLISSMARERGIDFTLGIWQQIAWEGKHQGSKQESMVTGLTRKNMHGYTYHALLKLLKECPDIIAVQLRINHESGIDYDEQTNFFRDAVFKAIKDCGRPVLLEIRNVGLLRETLEAALDMDIPVRVSHKYWGEHMVFPYHPTRIMWTYSYGDWLKYPQRYSNIYQVWTLGSHRLLLWGDPEFVRRFAATTTFQDSVGFEICAPLSQKGFGNAPGAWRIFRENEREYYQWEFQRYWSFYELFGHLTYKPDQSDEIWLRELGKRFGREATLDIAAAYSSASRVLSYIMGSATSNYNMGIWPEKDMGGLINFYLHLMPYDICRSSGFLENVKNCLMRNFTAKLAPDEIAVRLEKIAEDTENVIVKAETSIKAPHKEFWATKMDFLILSSLARYHAQKIRAASCLGFYYSLGDLSLLKEAQEYAAEGINIWKELSSLGEEIYYDKLVFGPGSIGHWKDNLLFVEKDLDELRHQEDLFKVVENFDFGYDFGPKPFTAVNELYTPIYTNYYTIERRFHGVFPNSLYNSQQGFGWEEGEGLRAQQPERIPLSLWRASNLNSLNFPKEALLGDFIQGNKPAVFRIDLPEGHYQGAVFMVDRRPIATDHGPLSIAVVERFGERPIVVDKILKKGELAVVRFNFNTVGSRFSTFRLKLSAAPGSDFILNAFTITRLEPYVAHLPVRRALPGKDLIIKATVTIPQKIIEEKKDSLSIARGTASTISPPEKIERVRLCYFTNKRKSYRTIEMQAKDKFIYAATIPGDDVKEGKVRYYLEAEDSTGQIVRLPKTSGADSSFLIKVSNDRTPPMIIHNPWKECNSKESLEIKARITDQSVLTKVLLIYRSTRQAMEYSVVSMIPKGNEYSAFIPGSAISKEFDIMYYIEAVDEHGNGIFYPNPDVEQPYVVVKVRR